LSARGLEEEPQQLAVGDDVGVEDDLDGFGVVAVVPVGRVRRVSA
jgi:hypothetical protein